MLLSIIFTSLGVDPRVTKLIARMTLEEKAGQLGVFARPGGSDFNPGTSSDWNATVLKIKNGEIGALFNGAGVKPNLVLQRVAVEESRLGIPLIFGADVWHGMHTVFPIPLGEAASWEPDLAALTARATAVEATASGLQWTYSPMVDVARDQRWGRVAEGAGEDPFLGSAFATARVTGFQGTNGLNDNASLISCLKHYAGYGGVAAGLDYSAADMSEATFRDVFLPPFKAGVDAGSLTLMSAFIAIVGGIPASGSRWLQTEVLRNELNFDGFVVSDYEADRELIDHGYAVNESDAARKALWAGVDMSMQSGLYNTYLPSLVRDGVLPLDVVDTAVRRVLESKARMGLFDDPYRSLDAATEAANAYVPAHDKLARHVATRSVVLLKNSKNSVPPTMNKAAGGGGAVLPLSKKGQKIALIGWWVEDRLNAEGVGVIWGNVSGVVTLAEGVKAALTKEDAKANVRVVNGSGCEITLEGGIAAAVAAAAWSDVVVLALGEAKNFTGEAQSRTDITLPSQQLDLARAVMAIGKPVVVLLKNGRALALDDDFVAASDAIMATWFLGKMQGVALADLLFGDVSPSGRLPISFPYRSGQQPYHYNHLSSGRPCRNDARRHFNFQNCWRTLNNEARWAFGHGLTYAAFDYGVPSFKSFPNTNTNTNTNTNIGQLAWSGSLNITTSITNVGVVAADEVVQLYIHDVAASRVRPVRELKGFHKIHLEAGESADVTFTLTRLDLGFHVAQIGSVSALPGNTTKFEPGAFQVWVSPHAQAGNVSMFELLPL